MQPILSKKLSLIKSLRLFFPWIVSVSSNQASLATRQKMGISIMHTVILWILIGFACSAGDVPSKRDKLLLISFDGFRWNYLQRTKTPNFDWITSHGVQAVKGLKNAFITKTFPNHFTLVTGQWEETHGIVANSMFDPFLNATFSPHDEEANHDAAWFDQGGEPIWVTNQLQGKGKSGVVMWVGGGAPVKNVLPSKYMEFNADIKNETKIDTLVKWFKEDDDINLGLLYFNQPDAFGHQFGPESEQVTRMIGGLDELIGYLLIKLRKENLLQVTNIIITSDHGFTSTPKDKAIDLTGVVDPDTFMIESSTPVAGVWPKPGFLEAIYNNLTAFSEVKGHFTVYRKEDIPERFHYTHNRRIPPIIVVAENHYSFTFGPFRWNQKGNHGYDNSLQEMHPFFVAIGPAFKSGYTVETFESVDVYPLMCHILGLEPGPNNGSMDIVKTLLLEFNNTIVENNSVLSFFQKNHLGSVLVGVIILVGLATVVFIAVKQSWQRKKEHQNAVIMDDVEVQTERGNENGEVEKWSSYLSISASDVPLLEDQDDS